MHHHVPNKIHKTSEKKTALDKENAKLSIYEKLIGWIIQPKTMRFHTRQLAFFCALAAVCVGIQLAPRPPNIEATSLITFFVGVVFGNVAGGLFGALVMFVNGFLSPWGFAGLVLPFQIVGMGIVGAAGGVFGRYGVAGSTNRVVLESAIFGSFLTLIYDLITNMGVALISNVPIVLALIAGVVFSIVHIVSNTLLFGLAFAPLMKTFKMFVELRRVAD